MTLRRHRTANRRALIPPRGTACAVHSPKKRQYLPSPSNVSRPLHNPKQSPKKTGRLVQRWITLAILAHVKTPQSAMYKPQARMRSLQQESRQQSIRKFQGLFSFFVTLIKKHKSAGCHRPSAQYRADGCYRFSTPDILIPDSRHTINDSA